MKLGTVVTVVFVGLWLAGCCSILNDQRIVRKFSKYISEGGDVPSFTGMSEAGENNFARKLVDMINVINLSDAKRARALVVIDMINARRESRGIFGYAIQY